MSDWNKDKELRMKRISQGLCARCGEEPFLAKSKQHFGVGCLTDMRYYSRKKTRFQGKTAGRPQLCPSAYEFIA